MRKIATLAWKNIWRNKVRSGVILSAIAIGLFAGTFTIAFMNGWILETVNDDINRQYSHIQIHDPDFLSNYDINAFFNRDEVEQNIGKETTPMQVAYRLYVTGMLASPYNAVGVNAKGVWEEEEKQVTTLWKQIPDTMGAFLPDNMRNGVVISDKIAEKLKVKLKSKIVFTFQDIHGDMQSIAFRVCGIYKMPNPMPDIFVRYSDIAGYTGLPEGAVHEVAIKVADIETCKAVYPQLKSRFPNMDVRDWSELNPAMSLYFGYTDFMGVIILSIFLFALSFGIINTMLMAVLERTRELGMLGAIGMSKRKIFSMIMLETIFLTFVGSIVGIILGTIVALPLLKNGIDLSFFINDYFEDYGFSAIVYPVLDFKMMLQIIGLVLLAGILSAIYPARKALKLKPLEALRES